MILWPGRPRPAPQPPKRASLPASPRHDSLLQIKWIDDKATRGKVSQNPFRLVIRAVALLGGGVALLHESVSGEKFDLRAQIRS